RGGLKTVLDNVDLRVAKSEFVSLVGPSGCGKSTLFRLFLGAEEQTSGALFIGGDTVEPPDPTRGIVYQQYALFPHLTVLDNIVLGHRLSLSFIEWHRRKDEIRTRAIEYLATAQLEDQLYKYPHQLSGGQQQRASVIQALMMSPKVLLMDEPFGALDPGTRVRMQTFLLKKWEETGTTIVFVTHDLEEAVFLGTRVVVLSQHYTDGRGDGAQRGSRIVCDLQVGKVGQAASSKSKEDPAFTRTIEHVRKFVLKPEHAWHLEQFDLQHPDSFTTTNPDELEKQ
ncbi:MAG: NitT/TauT family transport system ATP-binding protein, partial [Parcubacteria group bacterium Gr01-1014_91]